MYVFVCEFGEVYAYVYHTLACWMLVYFYIGFICVERSE